MFRPTFLEAIAFAGGVALLLILTTPSHSHSWYDTDCCDTRDCRPLEPDEVRSDGAGGYIWESKVSRQSYHFPASSRGTKLRASGEQSKRFHGCEAYMVDDWGSQSDVHWDGRCLYEPQHSF